MRTANEIMQRPVTLTVRRRKSSSSVMGCSVELPEGVPIAGVSSATIETDANGAPVLTIKISNFSVDMSDTPAPLYQWPTLDVPARIGFRR